MTPERRQLVLDTWMILEPHAPDVGATFFRHLFEIDPAISSLFTNCILQEQALKFTTMLGQLIRWLDSPERLVPIAKELGVRHAGYGVRDEHYLKVGAALSATLEEWLGDVFTTDARGAWSEAYLLISSLMRRGAIRVSGVFRAFKVEPDAPPAAAAKGL